MIWQQIVARPLISGLGAALIVSRPLLGLLGLTLVMMKRRVRRAPDRVLDQQALAARVLLVGLTSGLSLLASLEVAATRTSGAVANELILVIRRSRREGIAQALSRWTGPHLNSLLTRLAMAAASGAPMLAAVASYLAELRLERRSKALEKARRLPVTLMIPLGLLILPGFVLLFVGPVLLTSLVELSGSLPS